MAATPTEVVGASLLLAGAGDYDGYVDLLHDEIVFEFPFAPPGRPKRVEGKADLRDYLGRYPGRIEFVRLLKMVVHETVDPEVVVLEMSIEGRLKTTGEPYQMGYISVVTVRDGRILRYRDYWNPLTAVGT
jgi:ketosteroid isomerase-like protein